MCKRFNFRLKKTDRGLGCVTLNEPSFVGYSLPRLCAINLIMRSVVSERNQR